MKKILIIITIVIISFGTFGCQQRHNSYIEISFEELASKVRNKETFLLLIGAETCTACQSFKPTLEKIIRKYNIIIYYIDLEKLEEGETIDTYVALRSTPNIVSFTLGAEESTYNRIVGDAKSHEVIEYLKKNKYIKE